MSATMSYRYRPSKLLLTRDWHAYHHAALTHIYDNTGFCAPSVAEMTQACKIAERQERLLLVVQAIPANLAQLQRLKSLNFNSNRISSVPSEVLTGCQALHALLLHANPISAQVIIWQSAMQGFCTCPSLEGWCVC